MLRKLKLSIAVFVAIIVFGASSHADTMDDIQARGSIRIGVKDDYAPFGYRENGVIKGIEIEIANAFAKTLGVQAELIKVTAADRFEKLLGGDIDVILATMSDTPDRRALIGMIEPAYYDSGIALMAKKDALRTWEDLADRAICGVEGAFFNRLVSDFYGARVVEYLDVVSALGALHGDDCLALVFDEAFIRYELTKPMRQIFEIPTEPIEKASWVVGVRPEDLSGRLGMAMSQFLIDLHCDGRLLELESGWYSTPGRFLLKKKRALSCQ